MKHSVIDIREHSYRSSHRRTSPRRVDPSRGELSSIKRSSDNISPLSPKYTSLSEIPEFVRRQPSRPSVADEMIGELWAMVGLFTSVSVIVWLCLAVW